MKHTELKKLIKEEIRSALNEYDPNQDPENKGSEAYKRKSWKAQFGSMDGFDKAHPEYSKRYTDKEMLQKIKVTTIPDYFTVLDIIELYDEQVIGYLRSKGELNEVNELEADPTGVSVELFIPLRKSIAKALDDVFMTAVKNDQSEEELDRSLKTVTDVINNILLGTIRNKKKYYKFD
jgi:hypothetical protein